MENRRTIIAIILIAIIWLVFNNFITSKVDKKNENVNTSVINIEKNEQTSKYEESVLIDTKLSYSLDRPLPSQEIYSYTSPLYKISFSSAGAAIVEYEVNKYKEKNTQLLSIHGRRQE